LTQAGIHQPPLPRVPRELQGHTPPQRLVVDQWRYRNVEIRIGLGQLPQCGLLHGQQPGISPGAAVPAVLAAGVRTFHVHLRPDGARFHMRR